MDFFTVVAIGFAVAIAMKLIRKFLNWFEINNTINFIVGNINSAEVFYNKNYAERHLDPYAAVSYITHSTRCQFAIAMPNTNNDIYLAWDLDESGSLIGDELKLLGMIGSKEYVWLDNEQLEFMKDIWEFSFDLERTFFHKLIKGSKFKLSHKQIQSLEAASGEQFVFEKMSHS